MNLFSAEPIEASVTCLLSPNNPSGDFQLVYELGRWPERVRAAKGWDKAQTLYIRPATEAEKTLSNQRGTFPVSRFHRWSDLTKHEQAHGIDADSVRQQYMMDRE